VKNIMIIDGADNCAYDVFAATDDEFAFIFPAKGQDVAFADEIWAEPASPLMRQTFDALWTRPVDKKTMTGLHGTIYFQLENKKQYYPNRKDSDLTDNRSRPQR
jgi:hypothetical protein